MKENIKKKRTNIPQLNKVKAFLQKEIKSICPFCQSEDVEHFEIHHIDEDPSHHERNNLLLVCPTCHSKINKGDITKDEVVEKKGNLKFNTPGVVQLFNVTFFKFFDIHKSVVHSLNSSPVREMIQDANVLATNCSQVYGESKDFFDLIYRILHLKYKCHSNIRDFSKVKQFFHDYDWMIKNYFNSFVSLVELLHNQKLSKNDSEIYIKSLHSSTMDEIRLLFYYIISREEIEKQRLIKLFKGYDFFKIIKSPSLPLIYQEDWDEYE